MVSHSNEQDILKRQYPIVVRTMMLIVLVSIIVTFRVFSRPFERRRIVEQVAHVDIEQFDIPQTQQFERPPPPPRPSVPVASEDEELADDVTLEEINFEDFEVWEAPPPPPSDKGPRVRFIPYDEPPLPIGGYAAIKANIIYPEIARVAGVEGNVVLQAFVNRRGKVTDVVILTGLPGTGLNQAAMDAVKKTPFKPAKQRDVAVGVWISIPINFKLHKSVS
ncbi:MAG: energy transducer TonB [Candidatus Marinimicrobia bacterium]|nr:energy transducer TonB [Candidatus Neomarinimicrobiota bacterium]MDP6593802.1 energy transducer TonB [Candidatus Neomarinimicrobiota bacterium]MDP6837146.1 energy transducer TonB [Candidatus Neomarinimicrobiota bacterium]